MRGMFITVSAQFIALHFWKEAPEQVAFLRNPHRHVFKVRASIRVEHGDRDSEFFMVQEQLLRITKQWDGKVLNGQNSCEHLATAILEGLRPKYPKVFMVEVSEDGENSATVVDDDGGNV